MCRRRLPRRHRPLRLLPRAVRPDGPSAPPEPNATGANALHGPMVQRTIVRAMEPVLVTGGTGPLGREVVALLAAAGRPVKVLSRTAARSSTAADRVVGDLATGAGLAEAT